MSVQSPWLKIETPKVHSLEEVISEQLASSLHDEELRKLKIDDKPLVQVDIHNDLNVTSQQDPDDYILASLLQLEFDKEYDMILKNHESLRNKNSKVAMSYDNFKVVHPIIEKDEMENVNNKPNDLDLNALTSSESDDDDLLSRLTFKNGVHGKGENMISKHDLHLTGKRNASRIMKFPPEFETGDSHTINMSLSNNVFNALKVHSIGEEKRRNRLHDKHEKATSVCINKFDWFFGTRLRLK
jgi:RIO kinase 3